MVAGPRLARVWKISVFGLALVACETARNPGGIQRDLTSPTITLSSSADTQDIAGGLRFTVNAVDNLALRSIRLIYSGGDIGLEDTLFTGQNTNVTIGKTKTYPSGSGAGGLVQIVGRATDGAGNFDEDTIFIFLRNVQALQVRLLDPAPGALASTGRGIPVTVEAIQNSGISKIGFLVSPAAAVTNPTTPPADSLTFSIPYSDSVRYTDTLNVVATTGSFVLVGFAEDSAGRRGTSGTLTVNIQSAANDVTPPVVSHIAGVRVEVAESITVRATDPSAISWLGLEVRDRATNAILRFDSVNVSAGNLTDVTRRFSLNLAGIITSFPTDIIIRGYGCDNAVARNCAFAITGSGAAAVADVDTLTVVAGVTVPLPAGGRIADAIFNGNRNELYLTNPSLSRVEIFQVANTTFVATGIPTAGPAPWGVALFPRDTLGNYRDTIVVANSGGTQLSVIDVSPTVRRLLWRQDLPDFLLQKYKVVNIGGAFFAEITEYNISDRPQYLGTVCRAGGGTTCHADSVFAIYSTVPMPSNFPPFDAGGTVRMEKLINTTNPAQLFGHFFWEIDAQGSGTTTDTLRIVLRRGLPYNVSQVVLTACAGVTINFEEFALGDTTYVRNSGNFTHAFTGEGGNTRFSSARVMNYTTKALLAHGPATATSCFTSIAGAAGPSDAGEDHQDFGMSPGVEVADFISNTATKVSSIATNFNGTTNVVRADSIYYLDEGLRLKGLSPAPTGAPGMDMNYNHNFPAGQGGTPPFGGTGNPNDRLLFSARPDGNIDVWDTFFYGRIGTVPVRDPIIGPFRVARDGSGNQYLFGITARGLVVVLLPAFTNPFPLRSADAR